MLPWNGICHVHYSSDHFLYNEQFQSLRLCKRVEILLQVEQSLMITLNFENILYLL